MAIEPAYIIQANILRYQGLLKKPDITAVTRKRIEKLITEARINLGLAEIEEPRR